MSSRRNKVKTINEDTNPGKGPRSRNSNCTVHTSSKRPGQHEPEKYNLEILQILIV